MEGAERSEYQDNPENEDKDESEGAQMSRRVIISGGRRGVGGACVRRFCREGDRVAFFYRSRTEEAERLCRETGALAIRTDVSDPDAVRKAVAQAVDALGGVDVLISNAGVSQIKLFHELSDAEWRRMLDTDLSAAFYLSREVAPYMIREQAGKIVYVGSMWGKVGASCEVAYSAAKAGVRGLTMAQAKELGPSGITVNCVEPGVIRTEMNAGLSPEVIRELCEETPLGRMGEAEEIAAAIAFLASPAASFITGQCLGVDGGFAV